MIPFSTLYDDYIDQRKLTEQKNPFEYIVPPSRGVGTINLIGISLQKSPIINNWLTDGKTSFRLPSPRSLWRLISNFKSKMINKVNRDNVHSTLCSDPPNHFERPPRPMIVCVCVVCACVCLGMCVFLCMYVFLGGWYLVILGTPIFFSTI